MFLPIIIGNLKRKRGKRRMIVNPFWFGFVVGILATILFIIVLAVFIGTKGGKK